GPGNKVARVDFNLKLSAAVGTGFEAYVRVSDTDDHTGTSYVTADLIGTGGAGSFEPTEALRYAMLMFYHVGSTGFTDSYETHWRDVAVIGDHGVTVRGSAPDHGFLASDIA